MFPPMTSHVYLHTCLCIKRTCSFLPSSVHDLILKTCDTCANDTGSDGTDIIANTQCTSLTGFHNLSAGRWICTHMWSTYIDIYLMFHQTWVLHGLSNIAFTYRNKQVNLTFLFFFFSTKERFFLKYLILAVTLKQRDIRILPIFYSYKIVPT